MGSSELVDLQETLYTSSNPTRRWLHCSRRDWIVSSIKKLSSRASTNALEVGPGSGVYIPVLAAHYKDVTALDIQEEYLLHVNKLVVHHGNVNTLVDDITCCGLPDNSFDVILCTEVVEHIPNSPDALSEMRRLLRPGGALILSTPQRFSPLELAAKIAFLPGVIDLVRMIYREPILETGHINLMTERTVRKQLADAGFQVQEGYKSGMYLPLVAEFMGQPGLKLEKCLEGKLRGSMAVDM